MMFSASKDTFVNGEVHTYDIAISIAMFHGAKWVDRSLSEDL